MVQFSKQYPYFAFLFCLLIVACKQNTDNQEAEVGLKEFSRTTSDETTTDSLVIILLKAERTLEFWHWSKQNTPILVRRKQMEGAALAIGPRLSDNSDRLPEGVYKFNSPSKIDFPNAFDRSKAGADHRKFSAESFELPGGRLFQPIIDALQTAGSASASIIIAPSDLRHQTRVPACVFCPAWSNELYNNLRMIMDDYKQ